MGVLLVALSRTSASRGSSFKTWLWQIMHVDAVGSDFRLYPIPNCGKGQPMQSKRLGNGGPTMRGRARLTGGS